LLCAGAVFPGNAAAPHWQFEKLDRGLAALRQDSGRVFLSWRLLITDPAETAFHVYRQTGKAPAKRLTAEPLRDRTWFLDAHAPPDARLAYFVRPVVAGREGRASRPFVLGADSAPRPYLRIPLQTPEGYAPNDGSVGDLDGDGAYELVLHQAGRGRDNSQAGLTDPPILQAYELDGALLWTIRLGRNIREGAHYAPFIVYDLDGDGRAEVACRTADGARDGVGRVLGDPKADWRSRSGRTLGKILRGPEYLTIFDGRTGAALAAARYLPRRHPDTDDPTPEQMKAVWGDDYGNRMDRFLACVAYLDGRRPSLVMCRGYYTRAVLVAWNWRDGRLTHLWTFDSDDGAPGNRAYRGQGNHNLSVGDVDGDGRDEIIYGACAIDDDGRGLYSTGLGHGDALHLSDIDPDHPGLEVFDIHERPSHPHGMELHEAATGKILWSRPSPDVGRGAAMDIDPRHPGYECWAAGRGLEGLFNCRGKQISRRKPRSCNFGVWWDGDRLRELLDRNRISKWHWEDGAEETLLEDPDCVSNNGSKATPVLCADILGDWREEVLWRARDNRELRLYVSAIPTPRRRVTLMHDRQYRLSVAWQNVGYNQPTQPGFYLGVRTRPARPTWLQPNTRRR